MRRRRFLDDVIVKVIVFRMTTTVNLLLLILRLVELELWGIFRPSQSVIYRITVGSTELAIVGNLSRLYLLDLVCIDLINVCGITLDDLNQEGVPATFQLL